MYLTPREHRNRLIVRLIFILSVVGILLFIGTVTYHFSENWSFKDSLYFSVISLTSRGFSNLHPTNWFSVLFSVAYLLVGVAILLYALSNLIAYFVAYYETHIEKNIKGVFNKIKTSKDKKNKWVWLKTKE